MAKVIRLESESDTDALAARVCQRLSPGDAVLLCGELGAGKTRFVRGCAKFFGVESLVSSPTFALLNIYESPSARICHMDIYRLSGEDEFIGAGLEDELCGSISFIEWAERAWDYLLPQCALTIRLEICGEARIAHISGRLEGCV